MANKINSIDGNRTAPVGPGRAVERARDAATNTKDAADNAATGVEITDTARQLAALEQALANQPVVDEARAAAIRNDIEQGRYQIVPQKIADQMLQLEQALGHLER